ncbi:hypothetical protein GGR54DRAFT_649601 [Hypoxylon sp. NC1633]|nr:hypothetical protein GGR54DRAFT_649601 [Hypoxylon sp. NC1633]
MAAAEPREWRQNLREHLLQEPNLSVVEHPTPSRHAIHAIEGQRRGKGASLSNIAGNRWSSRSDRYTELSSDYNTPTSMSYDDANEAASEVSGAPNNMRQDIQSATGPTDSKGHQPLYRLTEMGDSTVILYEGGEPETATAWGARTRMWNSIWLGTGVFITFGIGFTVLLLATILLYHFSEINKGLSVQDASKEYGWRYGPTAFLTVILSLWNQVDFATRTLTPWKELLNGPAAAEKTVLLDYISPLMTTVIWRAAKARHWTVLASIFGVLLIQLATIFSGGLFTLEPTILEQGGIPLTVTSAFDGNDYRLDNSSSNVGTYPTIMYYGTRIQGLTPAVGLDIGLGLAVPDFELQEKDETAAGTNYTAAVAGAKIGFECEYIPGLNGTKTFLPWWSILAPFWTLNITTPSCNLTNIIVGEGPDHNMYHQENATQAFEGYFGDFLCDQGADYSAPYLPNPSNASVEHRIVMTMADLRFAPYNASYSSPRYIYLNNLTVAVCKPSYALGNYNVTYLNSLDGKTKSMTTNLMSNMSSQIPGFAPADMGAAVQYSLDQTYLGTGGQDWVLSKQVVTFFQVLSAMNGNVSIGAFMDPQRLINSGTEAFKGIATLLIHEYMMKPGNTSVEGSILYEENRLWVTALSVGFMCACFGILAGLCILQIFVRPWDVAPRDPSSIGATAIVLASSPKFQSLLHGLGTLRSRSIRQRLSRFEFRSQLVPGPETAFMIDPVQRDVGNDEKDISPDEAQTNKWWVPVPLRWWFHALTIVIPLIIIGVLEVLQHSSDSNQGFIDVDPHGFANTHGFAAYIPTFIAFCISSMFAGIQFGVCTLAPWMALQRGSAPASQSLLLNLTGRLAPHRIFLALQSRNFGVALIIVATLVTAWLPIVVSGLYLVNPAPVSQQVTMRQSDVFDPHINNLFYFDGNAGTITGLIALEATDFDSSNIQSQTQTPFLAQVEATRASVNCTIIPQSSISTARNQFYDNLPSGGVIMDVVTRIPWVCDYPAKNVTSLPWNQTYLFPNNTKPIYFGKASVLSWGLDSVWGDGSIDTDFNHPMATSWAPGASANWVGGYGCPSIAVTLGRGTATPVKGKNKTDYTFDVDMSTIVCSQHLQTVNTSVAMSFPSVGTIIADPPPVPDESTARYLLTQLAHSLGRTFEFPLNAFLLSLASVSGNNTVPGPNGGGSAENNDLDGFVSALATTSPSTPITSLAGSANAQALVDATRKLYGTYMAQALSSNMRSRDLTTLVSTPNSAAAPAEQPSVVGSVTIPGRLRLTQQRAPKVALQAMLAVMIVCLVAGRLLLRGVDQVVPHNPCSFAGTATLLADGEVCTRKIIPPGAEWRSDAELRSTGVFDGWMFSLGWWESLGVYKYGVDIGWIEKNDK